MQENKEFILTILGEKWTLKFVHEQDDKYLKPTPIRRSLRQTPTSKL